jgi:hypothetical protein
MAHLRRNGDRHVGWRGWLSLEGPSRGVWRGGHGVQACGCGLVMGGYQYEMRCDEMRWEDMEGRSAQDVEVRREGDHGAAPWCEASIQNHPTLSLRPPQYERIPGLNLPL